jgi:hypothetical protein
MDMGVSDGASPRAPDSQTCGAMHGKLLEARRQSWSVEPLHASAGVIDGGRDEHPHAMHVAPRGREALHAQGIISPDFECRNQDPASVLQSAVAEYPRASGNEAQNTLVITQLTIGIDGLARDPQILLAIPQKGFAVASVESWLNSRFTPAQRGGRPLESRLQAKLLFAREGAATLAELPAAN